jgi:hypothetical protein
MFVKLILVAKVNGQWRQPGEVVDLPEAEARRLITINAATATGADSQAAPESSDLDAMRAELAELHEFRRQRLEAEAKAQAEKEEAERKAAEEAAAKAKTKAGAKGEADGQTNGK